MKILVRILLGMVGLVVLLLGIGFLLPADFKVQRATTIKAAPERIYALIAAPREWKNWSVWTERDPAMKIDYSGPEMGTGAKWAWQSATEGNGEMEFTSAKPGEQVGYELRFPDMGMTSHGSLTLLPEGAGVTITWTNAGKLGMNPINRWFGLFMDRLVGADFEAGLAKLKKIAEAS